MVDEKKTAYIRKEPNKTNAEILKTDRQEIHQDLKPLLQLLIDSINRAIKALNAMSETIIIYDKERLDGLEEANGQTKHD